MKSKVFIILLLILNIYLFAFDFNTDEFALTLNMEQDLIVTKNFIYILGDGPLEGIIQYKSKRPQKIIDDYGYAKLNINNSVFYLLEKNGIIYYVEIKDNNVSANYIIEGDFKKNIQNRQKLKSFSASSFLTEDFKNNKIEYIPDGIFYRFIDIEKGFPNTLNAVGLPWVPDSKKDSKPVIKIETTQPIKMISILGGFIDFKRLSLFKDNSRPMTILFTDNKNNEEYTFNLQDKMDYNVLRLKKPTTSFQLKFIDNYKGLKYSDLCISSVILDEESNELSDYGNSIINFWKKYIN